MNNAISRLKVFTWHIHGSYLYYLSHIRAQIFVPYTSDRREGYMGLPPGQYPWPDTIREIPADRVKDYEFDVVLYQHRKQYLEDARYFLNSRQKSLPTVYLEHDPPRQSPTDTKHPFYDKDGLMVHVTHFNRLMWDNGRTETAVIEHGVPEARATYSGKKEKGIVVVNNIDLRGRRLGLDLYEHLKRRVPLDIIGAGTDRFGGLGEIHHEKLAGFLAPYRFFLNPIRYTSLPLSLIEAMMTGLPVVAFATTEIPDVLKNGITGFMSTDPETLATYARRLIDDPVLAADVGANGRAYAGKRFSMERFVRDWELALMHAVRAVSNRQKRSHYHLIPHKIQ